MALKLTRSVLRNPCVLWMTVETLGLAALFALCEELKDIVSSPTLAPVHSLQLNSEADLLRCLRSDEHLDSRVSLDFSKNRRGKCK